MTLPAVKGLISQVILDLGVRYLPKFLVHLQKCLLVVPSPLRHGLLIHVSKHIDYFITYHDGGCPDDHHS